MDNRTIQVFLALAETLHFGRAAEACHMSPSTLTRAIKQLEADVGVALFERDNRSVALTEGGKRFRQYARESTTLWDTFRNSVLSDAEQISGSLTLYGSVTASYSFLFERLARMHDSHPSIQITLQTGDPEQAITRVLSGDADISLGARPSSLPSNVAFKSIAKTPLVFIAPADSELHVTALRYAANQQWQNIPMILPERGVARDRVTRWFRSQGVRPLVSAQVAGNEAIVSMVGLGSGVGVVPQIVLENSPLKNKVSILPVAAVLKPLEVGLFATRKKRSNRLVDALWTI